MSETIQHDVFGVTDAIFERLVVATAQTTLRYKESASPDCESYKEVKPTVYKYTYETDSDELPAPTVLIQPTTVSDGSISYVLFVNVAHPSIVDVEITDEVPPGSHHYQYRDGTDFTSDCVRAELYRACLMLGNEVYKTVMRMQFNGVQISSVKLTPPSPMMSEFPFCSCIVEFTAKYSEHPVKVGGTRLQDLL